MMKKEFKKFNLVHKRDDKMPMIRFSINTEQDRAYISISDPNPFDSKILQTPIEQARIMWKTYLKDGYREINDI